jgi:hypothetical protein
MGTKTGGLPSTPLPFRQLCAIARSVIEADPAIDDFEWRERIKQRLVDFGFTYPQPHEMSAAMSAVEHATGVRRPAPEAPRLPEQPEAKPLTRDEARAALAHVLERTGVRLSLQLMPPVERRDERRIRLVLQIAQEIRKRQEPGA